MHVPDADLLDAAFALRRVLEPHGRLLLSLPLAQADVQAERDATGRLFKDYTADYLQLLFERLGFNAIGRWDSEDALGRTGVRWYTLLLELREGEGVRAVDQIEGILNRDRKEATYKLALFRALAELATQEPRCATWRPDGTVGVPIRRLSEKWLGYYWPLFAGDFVPQSQTEATGSSKQLSFRRALVDLMAPYRGLGAHGGLTAWHLDLAADRITAESRGRLEQALKAIDSAIRSGPVQYSGGSLETGTVFRDDRKVRQVVMAASLWRELTLLGHWIIDAVVLRWAELTERFGHRQGIRVGDVLPLLLARAEPLRAVGLARQIFLRHGVQRRVWSGRTLGKDLAVDHVIPFALWGNNDLWNLLPAHARVNAQKSDRLPTSDLLRARRAPIVEGWQLLRDDAPAAFDRQAGHLMGRPIGGHEHWEDDLFARLWEAVELTALQRGIERWAPTLPASDAVAAGP